jgi:dephospho-CoA kinase
VRLIGLTGGIASGKSTVAALLREHGAELIDADEIARDVVSVGSPALQAIVARFGPGILLADGSLDRPQLAGLVFADESSRAALNDIVHPEVMAEIGRRIEAWRSSGKVVVVDVPLMAETGAAGGFDAVLVVTAPPWIRIERLARDRGMSESEARARIASQATDEARRAIATHVIENTGSLEQLRAAVDDFWADITGK